MGKCEAVAIRGGGIGWVSSWLTMYQTLSISSIKKRVPFFVLRACVLYCILYTVCYRHASYFYFMSPLRVSASYLSFLAYVITFVLFYFLSSYRFCLVFVFYALVLELLFCISFTADGPQRAGLPIPPTATLPSCLWSLSIFQSLPGSRLPNFYRDASSALIQLVNQ